jgi:hypothetical protein
MSTFRVLLSVSDKTGLVAFARQLHEAGGELIASGGTARQLRDAELPVQSVDEVTGFPQILGGRVKTLHPAIHGGILARRVPHHLEELDAYNIAPIDLVVVNLYPFQQTVAQPNVTLATATLTIAALVLALFLPYRFAYILLSLVVAMMLYLAVRPLVEWLYRLGISKSVGRLLATALWLPLSSAFSFC